MTKAFLSLWNDYPAAMADEYEVWHTFEHVPERLTPPGIRTARRYCATGEGELNRYFTLYDLDTLETIQHPAYLDLVRNPTPWSEKMRLHFSNVLRIPAECVASGGRGIGAYVLVQAYAVDRTHAGEACERLALALQDLLSGGQLLAYRIGLAEPNQRYEVFEQEPQTEVDTLNIVVLVESSRRDSLEQVQPLVLQAAHDSLQPKATLRDRLFKLLVSFHDGEVPADRAPIEAGRAIRSRFEQAE
ncbi:MAG: hypothetical protein ACOH2J_01805 [Allorhizobium sp.]